MTVRTATIRITGSCGGSALLISVATDSGFEPHEALMAPWLRDYGAEIAGSIRVLACEKAEVLQRPGEFDKVRQLIDRQFAPEHWLAK